MPSPGTPVIIINTVRDEVSELHSNVIFLFLFRKVHLFLSILNVF